MSAEINNREYRQQVIQELISELHAGKSVDEVKQKFEDTFAGVAASEIADAEQALIAQGLPVAEVQRLCDVHAAVFQGSIEDIHSADDAAEQPGHPVDSMKRENRAIEKLIEGEIRPGLEALSNSEDTGNFAKAMEHLWEIDRHYLKKENVLFPYMERYGITAPPKVMWGVDDEIRAQIKEIISELSNKGNGQKIRETTENVLKKITEMIFKEENIMMPMLTDVLTQDEWRRIAEEGREFGSCLIESVPDWNPAEGQAQSAAQQEKGGPDDFVLPTGTLKSEEMIGMLNTLPIDITFVDKDDTVRYFSQGAERVFPRTKSIIGRKVANCHPPASVHIVEKIVEDLKAGRKDHEDFWIHMGKKFVYIRYYAVRSEKGEYLGVLEVTQDINPIQQITGEKRLAEPSES